jgi:elongation factor 4
MYNYIRFRFSERFPVTRIRNFCIIAHIDHGKSTLADRFLEITGTIPRNSTSQYLDKLKVEKERGITVKAQAVSMFYNYRNSKYLINFVDTPGHVDFNYEVRRSMRSCQGALLVIDSTQGIQAQTISNFELAKDEGLKILPVLNKIEDVEESIETELHLPRSTFSKVSAKTGLNVEDLIKRIVDEIPPPQDSTDPRLKLFLVNSWFLKDKGVACLFQVKSGELKKGMSITSCASGKTYQVFDVGILNP